MNGRIQEALLSRSSFLSMSMYLFQYQCFFHTLSTMSSIGTPFVSGSRNLVNSPMTTIHAAKKKKIAALMWHIIDRNACAMRKVKSMLELTAKANPAVLVSTGNVSLGINQPRGPHDQAKLIT